MAKKKKKRAAPKPCADLGSTDVKDITKRRDLR